jgi:predicted PurR-regulated permease PerM
VRDRGYALEIIAAGVLLAILYFGKMVFVTTIVSVIIAFILEPFVALLVRIRIPRGIASALVLMLAGMVLYVVGVSVFNQMSAIVGDVPTVKERLAETVTGITDRIKAAEEAAGKVLTPAKKVVPDIPQSINEAKRGRKPASAAGASPVSPAAAPSVSPDLIPEVRIHDERNVVSDYVYQTLPALSQYILMASFVPLLVYFMLSWLDHLHRSFLRFFDGPSRLTAARSVLGIGGMARAFVVGNFLIGVVLGVLSCLSFALLGLPYPLLIGFLSGFLSLVPYAGIVLAAGPPLLVAFSAAASSSTLILALVAATALHFVGMNVLYPVLVGGRVHLNPLIVTLSLLFWGFLWDAPGLLLAIPITAGLKAVCDNVAGLRKFGRFLGD